MATWTYNLPTPTRLQSPFVYQFVKTPANSDLVNIRAGYMGIEKVPNIYRLVAGRCIATTDATVADRVLRIRQYIHDGQQFRQMIGLKSADIAASQTGHTWAICPVTELVNAGVEGADMTGLGSEGLIITGDGVFQCYFGNVKGTDTWEMNLQFEYLNYKLNVIPEAMRTELINVRAW